MPDRRGSRTRRRGSSSTWPRASATREARVPFSVSSALPGSGRPRWRSPSPRPWGGRFCAGGRPRRASCFPRGDDRDDGNGDDDDTDPPVSTGPPFQGTVFISPAVITGTDPTRVRDSRARRPRRARRLRPAQRRLDDGGGPPLRLVRYAGRGTAVEFQVNLEFGPRAAREHVDFYAAALGRDPRRQRIVRRERAYRDRAHPHGQFGGP